MTKPDWLVEVEKKKARKIIEPNTCGTCLFIGSVVKNVRHKGKEIVSLHECDIHPGCFNTKYSICCDDWQHN